MRGIALSLVTVASLGVVLLGGRAIAADRATQLQRVVRSSTEPAVGAWPVGSPAGRLWYGGTLAPIIVVGSAADRPAAHAARTCAAAGS